MSESGAASDRQFLESIMGKNVRVILSDNRTVTGSLHCIDYACNLILYDVEIFLPSTKPQQFSSVMVPGNHFQKLEIVSNFP